MNSTLIGRWGEALVAEHLRKKRYKIIAANYRTRFGEIDIIAGYEIVERNAVCGGNEIDIIALDMKYVVFVEVKLRKNDNFGSASEFVTPAKQKKLRATAEIWLLDNETKKDVRFDVAEVTVYTSESGTERWELNYIKSAF